jgi:hypothetical protein
VIAVLRSLRGGVLRLGPRGAYCVGGRPVDRQAAFAAIAHGYARWDGAAAGYRLTAAGAARLDRESSP